jgi:hypothetical protein
MCFSNGHYYHITGIPNQIAPTFNLCSCNLFRRSVLTAVPTTSLIISLVHGHPALNNTYLPLLIHLHPLQGICSFINNVKHHCVIQTLVCDTNFYIRVCAILFGWSVSLHCQPLQSMNYYRYTVTGFRTLRLPLTYTFYTRCRQCASTTTLRPSRVNPTATPTFNS